MAIAKEIETSESLKPWLWYAGALHQHHFALPMLVEFFMHPYRKGAAFAWNYLDWVFEVPSEQANDLQKARRLLTKARNEMRAYSAAKRLRCPNSMRVASRAQAHGSLGSLQPAAVGAALRLDTGCGQYANVTRETPRSHPRINSTAMFRGIHQSPTTVQASAAMMQAQGMPVSVYGPPNDPMQGIETGDPRRPFDLEWVSLSPSRQPFTVQDANNSKSTNTMRCILQSTTPEISMAIPTITGLQHTQPLMTSKGNSKP